MSEYTVESLGKAVEHLSHKVGKLTDTADDAIKHDQSKENHMDIAGLLALMQNNRNMDLPALFNLAKDKGYNNGWGNDGMFMFVFLMLFLFANGGWGNLNRNCQQDFCNMAGNSFAPLMDIVGQLKDRIFDTQTTLSNQTQQLQTWLCQVTDAINAATRDQGDRAVAATQGVKDQLFQCCCDVKGLIAHLENRVDGLYQHGDILHERTINRLEKLECDLKGEIRENRRVMELEFERAKCDRHNIAKDEELARLNRENAALRETLRDEHIASRSVKEMQDFFLNHYTPTRTGGTGGGTAAA